VLIHVYLDDISSPSRNVNRQDNVEAHYNADHDTTLEAELLIVT